MEKKAVEGVVWLKNSTKFAELEIPVQKTVGDLEISYKTAQITVQNPL